MFRNEVCECSNRNRMHNFYFRNNNNYNCKFGDN